MAQGMTYKQAGVDIEAGNFFTQMIKERVWAVWPEMENEIGGFAGGGIISPGAKKVKGSVDGVGTKLKIAGLVGVVNTVGQDAVAMSAVDMYVSGCQPKYILDYLAVEKLLPEFHIGVIDGVIMACQLAGCRLIGGETAEMPGFFKYPWLFDLTTSVIGFSNPGLVFIPVKECQLVLGWFSNGAGSNGFSLLRKVFGLNGSPSEVRKKLNKKWVDFNGKTLAEVLLKPTPIHIKQLELERENGVLFSGHAHITGGGMVDNIPRILPPKLKVVIDRSTWVRPAIFSVAQKIGNIRTEEMDHVFNQGIMVASIFDPMRGASCPHSYGYATIIGKVARRKGGESQVQFVGKFSE